MSEIRSDAATALEKAKAAYHAEKAQAKFAPVRMHQEADPRVRANLPTPGKVDTAKAGCGHESGNQEGRICRPPQAN